MERYLEQFIRQDLQKKMVFLGGPRQVGKTTLSKSIGTTHYPTFRYLNWDIDEDRRSILKKQWLSSTPLLIFDELHKYSNWKQWIKGVYDGRPEQQQYFVTGSARLDVYKQGGDSLLGRYHYWRLHPFSIHEHPAELSAEDTLQRLMTVGGFPEPFLANDEREARRWRNERFKRILREDIRDLSQIRDLQRLELLVEELRQRAGQLINYANLAQDLQASPHSIKTWIELIERMYIGFSLKPLTRNVLRSVQKPIKLYFYDNADVSENGGARFENLVATHLLKEQQFKEDYWGHKCELHYIRDKEGREIDFVTSIDGEIQDLIEVKTSDTTPSKALLYYAEKLKPKRAAQLIKELKNPYESNGILFTNPIEFFRNSPWKQ